jgi:hypothetical protein
MRILKTSSALLMLLAFVFPAQETAIFPSY